ncbi:MAG: response regulator, partial [Gammaproteobacteria bacterium]|nr:response regulator [Gammaproteobacteria bacterium]
TPLDREQAETFKAAWSSGRSLLRIVSDILDWSKIEDGKLALAPRATSIPHLLQEVVNTYSRVASAKSLALWQHADAQLSPAHIVDPLRLSQVLNNFVSNAIKFTQHGEIELSAELLEQIESGERIRFSVKDTGIGIDKEAQQHLFQRYRQESSDTARMYGGTGLGLSICRRLVDLMDGQIELVSEPGQGSTFKMTLVLPVSGTPGEALQIQRFEVEQTAVTPLFDRTADAPLVLAVDDHPINRDLLARQLKLLGLRAETAENGKVALQMWRTGCFALVITDCHMPEMDGYALSRAIRKIEAEERLPRTPIIAWTANALAGEVDHCQAAGMDDVLVKPAGLSQLRKMFARMLCIVETDSTQAAPPLHDADSGQIAGPIDHDHLKQIVPDRAGQIKVLHDFQLHIRTDLNKLTEMLEQGDWANIESMAHRMKGSSRMVGATYISSVSTAIEQAARNGNVDGVRAGITGLIEAVHRFDSYLDEVVNHQGGTNESR